MTLRNVMVARETRVLVIPVILSLTCIHQYIVTKQETILI